MMAYISLFLFCIENGDDKSAEEILSFFIIYFLQYVLITYYLKYWQLLYIFLNKQEITEIPHLSLQPWPRPGALDNECN